MLIIVIAALSASDARGDRAPAQPNTPPEPTCAEVPQEMRCIPGGPFVRGSNVREADARPQATISISAFLMDTYEVTNRAWRECVAAGACRAEAGPRYKGFGRDKQPVVGVSWFDARTYCTWRGKRLPTEAEWERAARGPEGHEYPWGTKRATCARAIIAEGGERGCGHGVPPKGATADVGSRPAGAWGLYDMAGNAWEWVADWYSPSYATCGAACEGDNPLGPCAGADDCPDHRHRVVRGGSWYWPAKYARATWRRAHLPGNKPFHHFGFRCAKAATTTTASR